MGKNMISKLIIVVLGTIISLSTLVLAFFTIEAIIHEVI